MTILNRYFNLDNIIQGLSSYGTEGPFNHCVIDDFFLPDVAEALEKEFPEADSNIWHQYNNPIEIKKVCNDWNRFPALTYSVFSALNSSEFTNYLSDNALSSLPLYSDSGLNGGGWHLHKSGGKLNTHLDYSIHPKLGLQRKLNIIIYLNSSWQEQWGGQLGLWGNESSEAPGALVKTISPVFNRAVLFDTTQNSWHGLPEPLVSPEDQARKSFAVYFLCDPPDGTDARGKALFAPTEQQVNDSSVLELIKKRSQVGTASDVYTLDK